MIYGNHPNAVAVFFHLPVVFLLSLPLSLFLRGGDFVGTVGKVGGSFCGAPPIVGSHLCVLCSERPFLFSRLIGRSIGCRCGR